MFCSQAKFIQYLPFDFCRSYQLRSKGAGVDAVTGLCSVEPLYGKGNVVAAATLVRTPRSSLKAWHLALVL